MLQSISPYALLCASKPRTPRHAATQYDTYSLSQAGDPAQRPVSSMQQDPLPQPVSMQSLPHSKRTHYIADIHARHANAMRSTPQSSAPL